MSTQKLPGLLQPLALPDYVFEKCTMDIIAHLPVTQRGCDAIAMFVDCMSQYIYSVPCKSTISTEELTQLFIATVVTWYGMPKRIISDCDGRFLSYFWQSLMSMLMCNLAMSSAYHP